jgi:hypothetical protein
VSVLEGWVFAKNLLVQLNINDRDLRVVPENSDGRIISSRRRCLFLDWTVAVGEAHNAAGWRLMGEK